MTNSDASEFISIEDSLECNSAFLLMQVADMD